LSRSLTNYVPENNTSFIIFISIVASISGFLFGFDSDVNNSTVDGLQAAFNSQSVGTDFNVSSMRLCCAVGTLFVDVWSTNMVVAHLLLVAAVFFIISAWGSGISASSFEFVIYRVIGGLAVGAVSVMAPAYHWA